MPRVKRPRIDVKNLEPARQAILDQLKGESDRGCVLISCAFMDDILSEMLRAALVDDHESVETLVGPHGAASGFSERINLAYLMGLIGKRTRDDMNIMRDIRNACAHYHHSIKFADQDIADRCKSLKGFPSWKEERIQRQYLKTISDPKTAFVMAATWHVSEMLRQLDSIRHIQERADLLDLPGGY